LWYVDTLGGATEPTQASLIGASDATGSLRADVCYLSELFLCASRPKGVASLRWLVVNDAYGAVHVERKVSADRLVKEGWALSGDACKGTATSFRIGEGGVKGFALALPVVLRPVK
jgi:hypothetical protein